MDAVANSLPQVLRAAGKIVEQTLGQLLMVSRERDGVRFEYLSSTGQKVSEEYTFRCCTTSGFACIKDPERIRADRIPSPCGESLVWISPVPTGSSFTIAFRSIARAQCRLIWLKQGATRDNSDHSVNSWKISAWSALPCGWKPMAIGLPAPSVINRQPRNKRQKNCGNEYVAALHLREALLNRLSRSNCISRRKI